MGAEGIDVSLPMNVALLSVTPTKLLEALNSKKIAVVAGFQGVDHDGNITTLGRGGSDTTAVALAAALKADCCRIYKDVDGIYDRDPRKDPTARCYRRIGYEQMLSLSRRGAQVLGHGNRHSSRGSRVHNRLRLGRIFAVANLMGMDAAAKCLGSSHRQVPPFTFQSAFHAIEVKCYASLYHTSV